MNDARPVFLDFDGVLCDSEDECYVSSWLAWFGESTRTIALADRRLFHHYRPFIRRGGDYLLLQRCIAEGRVLNSQNDFDGILAECGEALSDRYHERFYTARNALLREDRTYWLALNVLYPGMDRFLRDKTADSRFEILSTKKASFIAEILRSKGIDWPEERIHCSGKTAKFLYIHQLLQRAGKSGGADFIDDQVDHFDGPNPAEVQGYLASWGYVRAEWLERSPVPVVDRRQFLARWGLNPDHLQA